MAEQRAPSGSIEEPALLSGEVLGHEGTQVRVRLDSGVVCLAAPPEEEAAGTLGVGLRVSVSTGTGAPDGSLVYTVTRALPDSPIQEPFDREVVELHNALANHHPSTPVRPVKRVLLGEDQIRNWIGRVDTTIARLRKSRAKRLNEEFYNGS